MQFSLRIIIDTAPTAAFNMAADLYLMEKCTSVDPVVTLRFYRWDPAAITLGCMQKAALQLDNAALKRDGIDWIRRPTGGRAVLHADDLTYSCVFSRSLGDLGSSVAATYSIITRCLVTGLTYVGVKTSLQESASALIKGGRDIKLPCFLAPNRNEIMVEGRKLVGSAQYRNANAVLQHGSIPLTEAYSRLPRYLILSDDDRVRQEGLLRQKCISLGEIVPALSPLQLIEALSHGFSSELGCRGRVGVWTEMELGSIAAIMHREHFRKRSLADDAWAAER